MIGRRRARKAGVVATLDTGNLTRGARTARMPGPATHLRVFERAGAGYVFDPATDCITWIAQVTAREYLLRATTDKNATIEAWARALAAACPADGAIAQVQLLERTVPDPSDTLSAYTAGAVDPSGLAFEAYRELTSAAGRGAAVHEAYIAISVFRSAVRKRIEDADDVDKALGFVDKTVRPFVGGLDAAGIQIIGRPSARRLGAILRSAFDPLGATTMPADQGVPPHLWGPSTGREHDDALETDGTWHAALVVFQWPQGPQTTAEFLHPIIFPEVDAPDGFYGRSLSLLLRPYMVEETRAHIQSTAGSVETGNRARNATGRVKTREDEREEIDLDTRQLEIDEGAREVSLAAIVTLSARSRDDLEDAVVLMMSAASNAGIDLRRMRHHLTQAFVAGALPLGKVVVA